MNLEELMELSPTETVAVLTGVIVVLCTYYVWKRQHRRNGYPDGPFCFPILGNLPQIIQSRSMGRFIDYYRSKYGDIFTIEIGGSKRVIISGYQNIYNILVKNTDLSSNRSVQSFPKEFIELPPGLFWAPFPHRKRIRSVALGFMKEGGMGKQVMEPKILDEINRFCTHYVEPSAGQPIDLSMAFSKATSNVISELIFGGRNEYDDPAFETMIENVDKLIKVLIKAGITKNIPFARYLKLSGVKELSDTMDVIIPEMMSRISSHRDDLDPDQPKDIFDAFLIHQSKFGEMGGAFTDGNTAVMAAQLYVAGTDSTATSIRWALLYTCLNPDVKAKVQNEIKKEIGERPISYKDRTNLSYTEAVLLETLRLANIAPNALPHLQSESLKIDGVFIPAGADLMLNMSSVLHDGDVFENPLIFKPERYLPGDVALKKQRTIPFGTGSRVCLGEGLVKMELFMFYVTLLQRYEVNLSAKSSKVSIEPVSGLSNQPAIYELVFERKH